MPATDEARADDFTQLLDPAGAAVAQAAAPALMAAAAGFWAAPFANPQLTPRMKELVLLALHATATSLDAAGVHRHVGRALAAGASHGDVVDVLVSIVGVANHALYAALPILEEELGLAADDDDRPFPPEVERAKADFVATRGFWNADRDAIARRMPGYFAALTRLSVEPWRSGTLTGLERELIYIAIDCTVTHSYAPGLRLHIRNAAAQGATREQMLEVFQLAAMIGLEGLILGLDALGASR